MSFYYLEGLSKTQLLKQLKAKQLPGKGRNNSRDGSTLSKKSPDA